MTTDNNAAKATDATKAIALRIKAELVEAIINNPTPLPVDRKTLSVHWSEVRSSIDTDQWAYIEGLRKGTRRLAEKDARKAWSTADKTRIAWSDGSTVENTYRLTYDAWTKARDNAASDPKEVQRLHRLFRAAQRDMNWATQNSPKLARDTDSQYGNRAEVTGNLDTDRANALAIQVERFVLAYARRRTHAMQFYACCIALVSDAPAGAAIARVVTASNHYRDSDNRDKDSCGKDTVYGMFAGDDSAILAAYAYAVQTYGTLFDTMAKAAVAATAMATANVNGHKAATAESMTRTAAYEAGTVPATS